MKRNTLALFAILALLAVSSVAQGMVVDPSIITLYTPAAGDAQFYWNGRYGGDSYTTGADSMGIYLYPGYGNDYTVSIFEIPIAELAGKALTSATLVVDSLGFGTGFYYGTASIGWLDTGAAILTGDVVADNLGPASKGRPGGFEIYNSDIADVPGLKYFDVRSCVQADLAAGRAYTTFVMSGSRETGGSIYTAESGRGPYIVASVPEPASMSILAAGLAGLLLRRRRRA